jgi:RHS repeat-associated protein
MMFSRNWTNNDSASARGVKKVLFGGEKPIPLSTGREWDKETGLYYYRARYYDPMEGRFISKDPISFKGKDKDANLYEYTENNPVNFTDPSGLFTVVGNCRGKEQQIKNELNSACKKLVENICDKNVKKCVQKSCEESKVSCGGSSCTDKSLLGQSWQGNSLFKFQNITLCVDNFGKASFGETAIHEWAHGCGWNHGDGGGVPGNDGKSNN